MDGSDHYAKPKRNSALGAAAAHHFCKAIVIFVASNWNSNSTSNSNVEVTLQPLDHRVEWNQTDLTA